MAVQGLEQTIVRDPALFYWILIPITVVMILTGILRHYATVLMNSPPKPASTLLESRERLALIHGVNLRTNAPSVLTAEGFSSRKEYLIAAYQNGAFLKDPENRGQPPANPMSDPAAMEAANQMSQQLAMANPAAGANPFQPGADPDKLYKSEAENLEVMEYFSLLDGIEERVLHN
ncbi:hypothetical protein F66182_12122 [Fusarium sp. NRRL 66182]|nr:hypothetical protein F66182_12122 [Fusarium sp. NRRL 66182]